ncbi:DEAD/DEAH box helicase [Candidatus Lokiarchaeum ossiferum]|uniref:DEAD/DEAH box helicase n=1 Tax=Candidatus Lokiarchaeum ossiferum TaxID=2951803 RepID=UPI00352E962F
MTEKVEEKKPKFGKQIFTGYVASECDRNLFLSISRKFEANWMKPVRKLKKGDRPIRSPSFLERLGHKYEKDVYNLLYSNPISSTSFRLSKERPGNESLTKDILEGIYNRIQDGQYTDKILAEFEYQPPITFFKDLLSLSPDFRGIPLDYGNVRPDILIIGNSLTNTQNSIMEILPNGEIKEVLNKDLETRLGINIFDVKNINKDKIGKKQFIEISYYAWTLAYYLSSINMNNKFFVQIEKNGIFPQYDKLEDLKFNNLTDFYLAMIPIKWNEANRIFTNVADKIRELWKSAPNTIENINVNIQPTCGQCSYLKDCIYTLGKTEISEAKDWSLKLIPYTSNSIAQQLEKLGFETIGDVGKNLNKIIIGDIPEPIYPELPQLALKTASLLKNDIVIPKGGSIYNTSIPKYSPISIVFVAESDPSNERLFAFGIQSTMSIHPKAPYCLAFDKWWEIWKGAIASDESSESIRKKIEDELYQEMTIEEIDQIKSLLKNLSNFKIYIPGDTINKKKINHAKITFQFSYVTEGLEPDDEFKLILEAFPRIYALLTLCNYIENHVVIKGIKEGTFYGPDSAIFYWSKEQLNNIEQMMQRNLDKIIKNKKLKAHLAELVSWFAPSDSEVTHPYQHKKMFNLQSFAETSMGFPKIINYTWHEIAKDLSGTISNSLYWIPHFNYMDFTAWHEFLIKKEDDMPKALELKEILHRQIKHKLRVLNWLRMNFQFKSNKNISNNSRPIKMDSLKSIKLDRNYHQIAYVWYLFSKLEGTMDELEAEHFRTIYPEFSIGKLAAAHVSNLRALETGDKKIIHRFELRNLSSNMKIKEGDQVFLIPEEKRDLKVGPWIRVWIITIERMQWNTKISGYEVEAKKKPKNLIEIYKGEVEFPQENPQWYLYPYAFDAWSTKLFNQRGEGLLQNNHFGDSWLGKRLSYFWDIRANPELYWPKSWQFNAPEVYYFDPSQLPDEITTESESEQKFLYSDIYPSPDPSQSEAIDFALRNVLYAIKGPPGTGKSQTIAALIDEYILRCQKKGKKSVKILVTAFSYSAIYVLIDKIQKSCNSKHKPTLSAQIQKIFIRSGSRDPIANEKGYRHIDDLVRENGAWKWNGLSRTVTKKKKLEEVLEDSYIIFANAHQLYRLRERVKDSFEFDLIIVDEASQLPTDQFMASLQYIHKEAFHLQPKSIESVSQTFGTEIENLESVQKLKKINPININNLTKVVIVGDYNQLPPVQRIDPPKNLEKVLDSLFSYYVRYHKIKSSQLKVNYRSHEDIVAFTSQLGIYEDLTAFSLNAKRKITGNVNRIKIPWIKTVLDPEVITGAIIHTTQFEIAISAIEASIVSQIVIQYFFMKEIRDENEERKFWQEAIGVVAPHNAQGRLIILKIFQALTDPKDTLTFLSNTELMDLLKSSIYSVEKFQGSDREFILATFGLSDKDQLRAEDEFIYDLNRFNVLTSRAKSKIIVLCSQEFLDYIPDDREIMDQAAQTRNYALDFCNHETSMKVEIEKSTGNFEMETILFRWKG